MCRIEAYRSYITKSQRRRLQRKRIVAKSLSSITDSSANDPVPYPVEKLPIRILPTHPEQSLQLSIVKKRNYLIISELPSTTPLPASHVPIRVDEDTVGINTSITDEQNAVSIDFDGSEMNYLMNLPDLIHQLCLFMLNVQVNLVREVPCRFSDAGNG
jgi:hypothetical protein